MEYEEMTVAQLKDVLRERELPVSGKKAELIARLQEADDAAEEEFIDEVDEDFDEDDEFFDDEWDDFHVARQKPVLD
ncbi:MAG: SAP domain-containing protein, partial [Candidatus Poseidoniia archaeon]